MQETQETRVWSPGGEDPLEEGMATHSSIFLPGEYPMDKRAWPAMVYRVAKSRTWLKWLSTHTHIYLNVYPMWSCLKMAWKLNCSCDITHWSLQAPCTAPGSSSWDMTLLCLRLSILGSSSPERTEITQLISKLTQRRSVGEKRCDFFFARVLFIQLKLGLKRWRDVGWRAIPPAWRGKKRNATFISWRRKGQPLPVFVSEKSHGQRAWRTTVQRVGKNQTWLSN